MEGLSSIVLLFGLLLPPVMLFLERFGVVTLRTYIEKWRITVLAIASVSMALTPPNPGSMLLLFVPLLILYCVGIGLCYVWPW